MSNHITPDVVLFLRQLMKEMMSHAKVMKAKACTPGSRVGFNTRCAAEVGGMNLLFYTECKVQHLYIRRQGWDTRSSAWVPASQCNRFCHIGRQGNMHHCHSAVLGEAGHESFFLHLVGVCAAGERQLGTRRCKDKLDSIMSRRGMSKTGSRLQHSWGCVTITLEAAKNKGFVTEYVRCVLCSTR
jgi:hypothetical protein